MPADEKSVAAEIEREPRRFAVRQVRLSVDVEGASVEKLVRGQIAEIRIDELSSPVDVEIPVEQAARFPQGEVEVARGLLIVDESKRLLSAVIEGVLGVVMITAAVIDAQGVALRAMKSNNASLCVGSERV